MIPKHLSDLLGLNISGHADIDFVDVDTSTDTELFVDPCLIKISDDTMCVNAQRTIDSFFDKLYANYKSTAVGPEIDALLQHLGERNEARMGYGNGRNGKGKTAEGMKDILVDLHDLIRKGIKMEHPIDLPLFLKKFDKDCLSDMLINILYKDFSEFTLEQCRRYDIKTEPLNEECYYWDATTSSWQLYTGNCLRINGRVFIMVPKHIVRKGYYYNTSQYFNSMIATRIQADRTEYIDGRKYAPNKQDIREDEINTYGSLIQTARIHTENDPSYLADYHSNMSKAYSNRGMTDDELDAYIYGAKSETA